MRAAARLVGIALLLVAATTATTAASVGPPTTPDDTGAPVIAASFATNAPGYPDANASEGPAVSGVAYFTTSSGPYGKPLRIGFGAKPGADGFFVLTDANGTVVGTSDYFAFDAAVEADGMPIPFDAPVYGIRSITVTAYDDTNGNHEFDPGVDEPYRYVNGDAVGDTMTFVFPRTDGAVTAVRPSMVPDTPGERAVHHYRIVLNREVRVAAIALDYQATGIDARAIAEGNPTLKVPGNDGVDRIEPSSVETMLRGQVAVLRFDRPVTLPAGTGTVLSVVDVPNPTRPVNATVVLDPYGEADAGVASLEPSRNVPDIRAARFGGNGSTVVVNAYFPKGESAVVAVMRRGRVVGRSQPIVGQPDMSVDGVAVPLSKPLTPGETVTVGLFRDRTGDGAYGTPVMWGDHPVERELTFQAGATSNTTTTSSTDGTSTGTTDRPTTAITTPGFGSVVALGSLLALAPGAFLARRT